MKNLCYFDWFPKLEEIFSTVDSFHCCRKELFIDGMLRPWEIFLKNWAGPFNTVLTYLVTRFRILENSWISRNSPVSFILLKKPAKNYFLNTPRYHWCQRINLHYTANTIMSKHKTWCHFYVCWLRGNSLIPQNVAAFWKFGYAPNRNHIRKDIRV